ncbi:MAG: hypothetical protein V3V08_22290 [Nannocystaceae bacterium]
MYDHEVDDDGCEREDSLSITMAGGCPRRQVQIMAHRGATASARGSGAKILRLRFPVDHPMFVSSSIAFFAQVSIKSEEAHSPR